MNPAWRKVDTTIRSRPLQTGDILGTTYYDKNLTEVTSYNPYSSFESYLPTLYKPAIRKLRPHKLYIVHNFNDFGLLQAVDHHSGEYCITNFASFVVGQQWTKRRTVVDLYRWINNNSEITLYECDNWSAVISLYKTLLSDGKVLPIESLS